MRQACRWGAGALFAAVMLFGAGPASAEKRVALVVGNAAYANVPRLANPKNDAGLIADALRGLGFTLVGGGPQLDLDEPGLRRAVQRFGAEAQGADVALFYYAGHGVQVRGSNYLVPVDANPAREADVDFQMLDTNLVLRQLDGAGAKLNIVLLDACRNNPFGGRGLRDAASGLAQMRASEGTIISFATQPGSVAADGEGGNSPYTRALAEAIRRPGLDIFRTFNEVGLAVSRATGGAQQPWISLSPIRGEFFFAGLPSGGAGSAAGPASPPPPRVDPCAAAADHWRSTELFNTKDAFEDHLARFPHCTFAGLARGRIAALSAPPPAPRTDVPALAAKAMGVAVTALNDRTREHYAINREVRRGVVVTAVDAGTSAAAKGLKAGDVIMEVGQEEVSAPSAVAEQLDKLRKAGRRSALVLISSHKGDLRFVALDLK